MATTGYPDWWLRGSKIQLIELVDTVNLLKKIETISSVGTLNTINTVGTVNSVETVSSINLLDTINTVGTIQKINPTATENVVIDRVDLIDQINKINSLGIVLSDWPLGWVAKPYYPTKLTNYVLHHTTEDTPTETVTEASVGLPGGPACSWTDWTLTAQRDFDTPVERDITISGPFTGTAKFSGRFSVGYYVGGIVLTVQTYTVLEIYKVVDATETLLFSVTTSTMEGSAEETADTGWLDFTTGFDTNVAEVTVPAGSTLRLRVKVYVRGHCNAPMEGYTVYVYGRIFYDCRVPDTVIRIPFKW